VTAWKPSNGHRRHTHQRRLLVLEHVGDGAVAKLGMPMGVGMFQATVEQPGVHLLVAGKAQPGREEALAHQPTWFSTWPFSQPAAGVHATGSTR
jgi:hypothetical protein